MFDAEVRQALEYDISHIETRMAPMLGIRHRHDSHTGPTSTLDTGRRVFKCNTCSWIDTQSARRRQKNCGMGFAVLFVKGGTSCRKPVENSQSLKRPVNQRRTGRRGHRQSATHTLHQIKRMINTRHRLTLRTHQGQDTSLNPLLSLGRRCTEPWVPLIPEAHDRIASHTHRAAAVVVGQHQADLGKDLPFGLSPQRFGIDQKAVQVEDSCTYGWAVFVFSFFFDLLSSALSGVAFSN